MPLPDDKTIAEWRQMIEEGFEFKHVVKLYPAFNYNEDQVQQRLFGNPDWNTLSAWQQLHVGGMSYQKIQERYPHFTLKQIAHYLNALGRRPGVREIPEAIPDLGYLYILGNASLPGRLKVGMTSRSPHDRARELSGTSVPTPFEVIWVSFPLERVSRAEAQAHIALGHHRVSEDREFFACEIEEAIAALELIESQFRLRL